MTETGIVARKDNQITAQQGGSAMAMAGQFVQIVPGYDQEFRFKLPRLGKIRLGSPKTERSMGRELDYFRLPEELTANPRFRERMEAFGQNPDQPKRLRVQLPSHSIPVNLRRTWDVYNLAHVLQSRWDGRECTQRDPKSLKLEPRDCAEPGKCKQCFVSTATVIHRLNVMLTDAPDIGVYQIDFKSANSYANLVTEMMLKYNTLGGKLAGVDLVLTREEWLCETVIPEKNGSPAKVTTVPHWLLHLRSDLPPDEMREQAKGATEYEVGEIEPMDETYDPENDYADFEVGEPPVEEAEVVPENLREELFSAITTALEGRCKTPALRNALCRGFIQGFTSLDECSVDQLQTIADRLAELPQVGK